LDSAAGAGSGEANTASNAGTTGYLPYKSKSGVNLNLRTLYEADTNLTFTSGTDSTLIAMSLKPTFDSVTVSGTDIKLGGAGGKAHIQLNGDDGSEIGGVYQLYEKAGTGTLSSPADLFFSIDNDNGMADAGNDNFKWSRNIGGPLSPADSVIMTLSDLGRLGIGKGNVSPLSPLSVFSPGTGSDTLGFNLTNRSKNTVINTPSESRDTSAFNVRFTTTGKPLMDVNGITGNSIFKFDSSGVVSIGGLTAGSVPFVGTSGAIRQSNTGFFFDSTNNRIGLGTTTPKSKITIESSTSSDTMIQVNRTSANRGLRLLNYNGTTQTFNWQTSNGLTGPWTNALLLQTNGNVVIRGNGGVPTGTNAVGVLAIGTGTAPTTGPASTAQLYATATGGLAVMDSSEKVTTLTEGGIKFNGSAPSVTGGLVGWDSTNRRFLATSYLVQRAIDMTHGVITADVLDSASAAEVTVDSIPMAANFPSAGKIVRVHLMGTYSTTANQSFTIIVRHGLGGEVIDSVQRVATNPGHTDAPFEATFTGTFRTIGASGKMVGFTSLISNGTAQADTPQGEVTVDNTALNTIYINVRMSSAAAGNKMRVRQAWAETKN
jgi:hypothetical protein